MCGDGSADAGPTARTDPARGRCEVPAIRRDGASAVAGWYTRSPSPRASTPVLKFARRRFGRALAIRDAGRCQHFVTRPGGRPSEGTYNSAVINPTCVRRRQIVAATAARYPHSPITSRTGVTLTPGRRAWAVQTGSAGRLAFRNVAANAGSERTQRMERIVVAPPVVAARALGLRAWLRQPRDRGRRQLPLPAAPPGCARSCALPALSASSGANPASDEPTPVAWRREAIVEHGHWRHPLRVRHTGASSTRRVR